MVNPYVATKAAPDAGPVCGNCIWAHIKPGKDMISCGVDLPPHVLTNPNPKATMVHKNYRCIFHVHKDQVV